MEQLEHSHAASGGIKRMQILEKSSVVSSELTVSYHLECPLKKERKHKYAQIQMWNYEKKNITTEPRKCNA